MKALAAHRLEVAIFVFVFGLAAYFYNGYNWNQTARYDAIWAFVEPGPHQYTFEIDAFVVDADAGFNTGDFARNPDHSPHYYSNKAPGTTLMGVPAYLVLYHAERKLGLDPVSITGVLVNAYLINLWVTVLPVALSAVFFFHLALVFTRERRRALLLTFTLYAGTLMLPFSTALWGHTTAAAFLVMAMACLVRPGRRGDMLCGLLVGCAVLTDYGAAPVALTLVVVTLFDEERRARSGAVLLGGLGPLLVFALYHASLFGSPFVLASSFSAPGMIGEDRIFGLFGAVNLRALWGLTLSASRGMFVYMPVLILSVYALRHARGADPRAFWWTAVATMLLVLVINTTFNGWHGGLSSGPRYQIIALPFYVLLLALLPEIRRVRNALYVLTTLSFTNMFVVAAVSPMAPDAFRGSPLLFCYAKLWDVLWIDLGLAPAPVGGPLSRGSLHIYAHYPMRDWAISPTDPLIERYVSFNLGELLLGLSGIASLLPALIGVSVMTAWMLKMTLPEDRPGGPRPLARHAPSGGDGGSSGPRAVTLPSAGDPATLGE